MNARGIPTAAYQVLHLLTEVGECEQTNKVKLLPPLVLRTRSVKIIVLTLNHQGTPRQTNRVYKLTLPLQFFTVMHLMHSDGRISKSEWFIK